MAYRIEVRSDTAANWASANPILSQGEMGYTTDTKVLKIGDGTTAWNSLTAFSSGGGGGGGTWGSITGTLSSQTDLQSALNAKAPLASPTFTGTVGGITAAMVGAPSGSGTCSGTNTGDQTSVSGNAGTVTTINGKITAGSGITLTGSGTAADPYNFVSTPGNIAMPSNIFIPTPVNQTIIAYAYALRPMTLNQIYGLKTSSGSLTLDVKINGTNVTGLSGLSVTTTPQSPVATAANTVAIGDEISYVISNIVNPQDLRGTLKMTVSY